MIVFCFVMVWFVLVIWCVDCGFWFCFAYFAGDLGCLRVRILCCCGLLRFAFCCVCRLIFVLFTFAV